MEEVYMDTAKVMAKGQITLPKEIRNALGITTGDRVALIRKDNQVILMNPAVYAMRLLQEDMKGEGERVGLNTDDDVLQLLAEMRAEADE